MATERAAKRLRLLGGMQVHRSVQMRVRRANRSAARRGKSCIILQQHKRAPNARRASASGRARTERTTREFTLFGYVVARFETTSAYGQPASES